MPGPVSALELLIKQSVLISLVLFITVSAASERIYEYEVPEEITIAFSGNSYKKYISLLDGATSSAFPNIGDEFKTFLKIFGTYRGKQGEENLFSGKARITGDWKDHLAAGKRISSLSISLKDGNVGGVVKFRLLIPDTRSAENEVFWSLLMEEIGYPVPYRRFVRVNVMGTEHLFLFEEKPEKEFLESNGFREGPILEYDERQAWENMRTGSWGRWLHQLKIKNSDFLKNKTSYEIAYRSLDPEFERTLLFSLYDQVNEKYASHGITSHNRKYLYDVIYNDYLPIYFDGDVFKGLESVCEDQRLATNTSIEYPEVLSKIKILEKKFEDRVFGEEFTDEFRCVAKNVFHIFDGYDIKLDRVQPLTKIGRFIETSGFNSMILRERGLRNRPPKYLYDPVSGQAIECFYIDPAAKGYVDRYRDLASAFSRNNRGKTKEEWGEEHYREFGNSEGREFFNPVIMDRLFTHYVERYPELSLAYQENPAGKPKAKWGRWHHQNRGLLEGRLTYDLNAGTDSDNAINRMLREDDHQSTWGNCRSLGKKKLKKIFSGEEKPLKTFGLPYFGFMNIDYTPQIRESFRELELVDTTSELEVDAGILYVKLTARNSTINIRLRDEAAYVVLHNSTIKNSIINVIGVNSESEFQDSRFNTKLLTSCFTLIDSEVHKTAISAKHCSREDAVNFIRVQGALIDLEIQNAAYDGFDSDFSNIHFDSVRIDSAGNDCVDLSAGVYNFNRLELSNCGDKAVSVGERSYVSLNNVEINGAKTGVASKDQSHVFLSGEIFIEHTDRCLMAYQKKQEFGPAYIHTEKRVANCGFETINRGFYEFGNTCEFVDRTYFFDLCANKDQLRISLNKALPRDHSFVIEHRLSRSRDWIEVLTPDLQQSLANCGVKKDCEIKLPLNNEAATYRVSLRDQTSSAKGYLREINLSP